MKMATTTLVCESQAVFHANNSDLKLKKSRLDFKKLYMRTQASGKRKLNKKISKEEHKIFSLLPKACFAKVITLAIR